MRLVLPVLGLSVGYLLAAREVLYPVTLYLVDLFLPDPQAQDASWPAAWDAGQPLRAWPRLWRRLTST